MSVAESNRHAAIAYAADGHLVFGLQPGHKRPYTGTRGLKDASSDVESVKRWWSLRDADGQVWASNIGNRPAPNEVVVDVDVRADGHATLADRIIQLGDLPTDAPVTRTPTGGRHIRLTYDGGDLVGSLGPGVDIKGHNGYVVMPPSVIEVAPWEKDSHPSALPVGVHHYTWESPPIGKPPRVPSAWANKLKKVIGPKVVARQTNWKPVGESVADRFCQEATWANILEPQGWKCLDGDGDRDGARWRHPRATSEYSATVKHSCLFVYSPNTPFEQTSASDPQGCTKFRAYAILNHGGDLKAAARDLRGEMHREAESVTGATSGTPPWTPPAESAPKTADHAIEWRTAAEVIDSVPEWAWHVDDGGRIPRNTLCLFAGRPAAGKSTAARWIVSGYTRGTVSGCFEGKPQNVAYLAGEESVEHMVKPSLRAHGADMARIYFPKVKLNGDEVALQSLRDWRILLEDLKAKHISIVVVDPIMSTISGKVDVHRSNETRVHVDPWVHIAEGIGGLVIGIVHLTKAFGTDVVAAINGSSAFGEVARSVIAFAWDQSTDDRILSQEKNSAGRQDLARTYIIAPTIVTTDDGQSTEVAQFALGGPATMRVADVLRGTDAKEKLGPLSLEIYEAMREIGQPASPSQIAALVDGLDNDVAGKYLRRLATHELVVKVGRGLFDIPANVKPRT